MEGEGEGREKEESTCALASAPAQFCLNRRSSRIRAAPIITDRLEQKDPGLEPRIVSFGIEIWWIVILSMELWT